MKGRQVAMSEAFPRMIATWPPEVLDVRLFELWAVLAIGCVSGFVVRMAYGPTAVGEIIGGIVLGPTYLDIVPYASALQEIGRLGLGIVLFDAGLRVEVAQLALPGTIRSTLLGAAPPAVLAAAIFYATHHMSLLECIGGGIVMLSSGTATAMALAEFPDTSAHGKELRCSPGPGPLAFSPWPWFKLSSPDRGPSSFRSKSPKWVCC